MASVQKISHTNKKGVSFAFRKLNIVPKGAKAESRGSENMISNVLDCLKDTWNDLQEGLRCLDPEEVDSVKGLFNSLIDE